MQPPDHKGSFRGFLSAELELLAKHSLLRRLRTVESPQGCKINIDGRLVTNFSSNDYLGFANHAALRKAACDAIAKFGVGAGASRLISGSLAPHGKLEEALAAFKGTEAALTFSSGYATALGTINAVGSGVDLILIDKLVHASIVDAARGTSGKLRVFPHNNLNRLESLLKDASSKPAQRILIITESLFSMDGDIAPLKEMVELKEKYGAWLMVDEAHATGVHGERGEGLIGQLGLTDRVEIQMGTMGKALGASGGFICGSRSLIDLLINRARPFIFSTAPLPANSAAAHAALNLLGSDIGSEAMKRLWRNIATAKNFLSQLGWNLQAADGPILPLIIGREQKAVEFGESLTLEGVYLPAVRFPSVARGKARLRLTMTASHSERDIAALHEILKNTRHAHPG